MSLKFHRLYLSLTVARAESSSQEPVFKRKRQKGA